MEVGVAHDNPLVETGHPLLNNVILKRIFDYLPFSCREYKNYRLVCKEWKRNSLPIWREKARVGVNHDGDDWSRWGIHYEEYLTLLESNEDPFNLRSCPFRNYLFGGWNFNFKSRRQSERQLQFWESVRPLVKQLTISSSHFQGNEDFRKVLFELTPNLESLALYKNYYKGTRDPELEQRLDLKLHHHSKPEKVQEKLTKFKIQLGHGHYPRPVGQDEWLSVSWIEVLLRFPNIQILDLMVLCSADPVEEFFDFLTSIQTIRRKYGRNYLANLTHLDITGLSNESIRNFEDRFGMLNIVGRFRELQFPLKYLSIDIGFETKLQFLGKVANIHSQTLKELTIVKGRFSPPFVRFPRGLRLPVLTSLTLKAPIFPNLSFLREMPNLELLVFQHGKRDRSYRRHSKTDMDHSEVQVDGDFELVAPCPIVLNTDFAGLNDLVMEKLKTFSAGEELCSRSQIEHLGKLMPNLTSLRVGVENEAFEMLCKTWKGLRTLEIHPFKVTEKGLLGIVGGVKYATSNLTDLQYLNFFRMGYLNSPINKGGLTNAAIVNGILRLEHLSKIDVCLSLKVSDKVYNRLTEKFPQSRKRIYKVEDLATSASDSDFDWKS